MKRISHLLIAVCVATLLAACGESEAEKAARRENEANDKMDKMFRVIEPKGNHPKY